jgi:hypothetical protein
MRLFFSLIDQLLWNDAGADRFARAINIAQKGVQRGDALRQAALQGRPFRLGQHARDDVEGDEPLGRLGVAIDGESDADAAEKQLRLAAAQRQMIGGHRIEPALQRGIGHAHLLAVPVHLIECDPHRSTSQDLLQHLSGKAHASDRAWPSFVLLAQGDAR